MKQAAWAFLVLLILAPCVKADTFVVTSGFYQPIGASGDNIFLSGDGFTASGFLQIAPFGCRGDFAPGQPITGCESNWITGIVTVTTSDGVVIPITYDYNFFMYISQDDMSLSGATQATLTETAEWGGFTGCINAIFMPDCPYESLLFSNDIVTLTMQLQQIQDPFQLAGGYNVVSERYDIVDSAVSIPEPNSLLLLGLGFASLAIFGANRPLTRALFR